MEELANATEDDQVLLNQCRLNCSATPMEIFELLDVDNCGSLAIEEFCEGLYQASVSKTPIELKRLDKRMDTLNSQMVSQQVIQSTTMDMLRQVQKDVQFLNVRLGGGASSRTPSKGSLRPAPNARNASVMKSRSNSFPQDNASYCSKIPTSECARSEADQILGEHQVGDTQPSARLLQTHPLPVWQTDEHDTTQTFDLMPSDMSAWATQLLQEFGRLRSSQDMPQPGENLTIGRVWREAEIASPPHGPGAVEPVHETDGDSGESLHMPQSRADSNEFNEHPTGRSPTGGSPAGSPGSATGRRGSDPRRASSYAHTSVVLARARRELEEEDEENV